MGNKKQGIPAGGALSEGVAVSGRSNLHRTAAGVTFMFPMLHRLCVHNCSPFIWKSVYFIWKSYFGGFLLFEKPDFQFSKFVVQEKELFAWIRSSHSIYLSEFADAWNIRAHRVSDMLALRPIIFVSWYSFNWYQIMGILVFLLNRIWNLAIFAVCEWFIRLQRRILYK